MYSRHIDVSAVKNSYNEKTMRPLGGELQQEMPKVFTVLSNGTGTGSLALGQVYFRIFLVPSVSIFPPILPY